MLRHILLYAERTRKDTHNNEVSLWYILYRYILRSLAMRHQAFYSMYYHPLVYKTTNLVLCVATKTKLPIFFQQILRFVFIFRSRKKRSIVEPFPSVRGISILFTFSVVDRHGSALKRRSGFGSNPFSFLTKSMDDRWGSLFRMISMKLYVEHGTNVLSGLHLSINYRSTLASS